MDKLKNFKKLLPDIHEKNILHNFSMNKVVAITIIICSLFILFIIKPKNLDENTEKLKRGIRVTLLCSLLIVASLFKLFFPSPADVETRKIVLYIGICTVFYLGVIVFKRSQYIDTYLKALKYKRLIPQCK